MKIIIIMKSFEKAFRSLTDYLFENLSKHGENGNWVIITCQSGIFLFKYAHNLGRLQQGWKGSCFNTNRQKSFGKGTDLAYKMQYRSVLIIQRRSKYNCHDQSRMGHVIKICLVNGKVVKKLVDNSRKDKKTR